MPNLCPVCSTELKKAPIAEFDRDVRAFSCYRCGDFALSRELIEDIPYYFRKDKNADVKLSHALRIMQRINEKVELSAISIDAILENPLPRPKEQADLLIRWLAEHTANPGDQVSLRPIEHHLSIIGTKTEEGIVLVLSYLIEKVGLVKGTLTETSAGYIGFDELYSARSKYRFPVALKYCKNAQTN